MFETNEESLVLSEERTRFTWSEELLQDLEQLKVRQRRAIEQIVVAELYGVVLSRLLKSSNSCRWCGRRVCCSKERLAEHEASCPRRGQPWPFLVDSSTFYSYWHKNPHFKACLNQARRELAAYTLDEATQILHVAAPFAAWELREQVIRAPRAVDRRQAAIAILDRRELNREPAEQAELRQLTFWLEELRAEQ
jgi:hypothetical protein